MDENKWTASTSTSWIYFDSAHTLKIITGTGGETIHIYVDEATEPTTDVEGIITITANGNTFQKTIKRCSPTVSNTSKTLDFCVNYSSVGGGSVGPCENGTSLIDTTGVKVRDIKLTTVTTYSNGQSSTETKNLNESDVNIRYALNNGTEFSVLPSNKDQDREVTVKATLRSDSSVFAPTTQQMATNPSCYKFTQLGIKDSNGQYIESRLHNTGYTDQSMEYRNFDFASNSKGKSSPSCEGGTFTFNVSGQKVTIYGGKTGLTECNEAVNIGGGTEVGAAIQNSDVTFSVQETQFASFNGNVLTYIANETRTNDRTLNISATIDGSAIIHTTFKVIKGNECGNPMYIVLKCSKENIDYTGGTATFKYYLTETEGGSEGLAIKDQELIGCLQFLTEQGVTTANTGYSEGVFSVDVKFMQNTYKNGEEGYTWTFSATCENASNNPQTISLYQANKWEQILPDCDYFIFHYDWESNDGTDLDSLTHISNCPTLSGKTVGYNGTAPSSNPPRTSIVSGNNGVPFVKFGGDNQCNGSEYTIVCLKNILDAFKSHEISFVSAPYNDTMYVDIYANWWGTKGTRHSMKIVYSQYSGLTTGGFDEEIYQREYINECLTTDKTKYYSFEPVDGKCISVATDVETRVISVNAAGKSNNSMARNIECIDGPYTHVLRLNYNFPSNTPTLQYFTDNGIDMMSDKKVASIDGVDNTLTYNYTASTGEAVHVEYNNVYLKHTVNGVLHNIYLFENDNDYITCNEYRPSGSSFKYKKSDLGTTHDLNWATNIKITKNSDKTINISFDLSAADVNREFDLSINAVTPYLGNCTDFIYSFGYIQTYQKISS